MLVIAVILWGVIIAAVVGALHHLMKRPHLTGEQKLIALLVSSVITVPVCGLLFSDCVSRCGLISTLRILSGVSERGCNSMVRGSRKFLDISVGSG